MLPVIFTIWAALLLFVLSVGLRTGASKSIGRFFLSLANRQPGAIRRLGIARWAWTLATVLYALHVAAAFHFVHEWSHAAAMDHVADQSQKVIGWSFAAGIWFNHLFTFLVVSEATWWWASEKTYLARAQWMNWAIFGYLGFIALNGAFVF